MVGEDKCCCQWRGKERLKFIDNPWGLDTWNHHNRCVFDGITPTRPALLVPW